MENLKPGGDIKYVYIFISIAVFIILLACINFTNLSTARSASRLKEVGIRKVFGVQTFEACHCNSCLNHYSLFS